MTNPAGSPQAIAARILDRCRELAAITDIPGQTTRTFLSPATHRVHALLTEWCEAAGLLVTVDRIGNLHATRTPAGTPRLLIGSHLDTVVDAGPFDGILGILLGLALTEATPHPIDLIAFSEEEGVRFRQPFLGSLALIGQPAPDTLTDANGLTLAEAIASFGHTPTAPSLLSTDVFAFLEFHIEQGPVLEAENRPLAAVSAITGQSRLRLTFHGQANHAGTTPMPLRRDALAAAAAWVTAVEACTLAHPALVATVGSLTLTPNLGNVIPGEVTASLDLRHPDDPTRHQTLAHLTQAAHHAAAARNVTLALETILDQPAVPMDPTLTAHLQAAAQEAIQEAIQEATQGTMQDCGYDASPIPSGAGHDAMILARRVPAAMLFLRTPNGLSHHPDESVLLGDIEAALLTGLALLARLFPSEAV